MKELDKPNSPSYQSGQRMMLTDFYINGQYPNCFYSHDCKKPVSTGDYIWTEGDVN